MKKRNFIDSLNDAINGIIHTTKTQRNMRYHIIACILVLIASLSLKLTRYEVIFITTTITLVIFAELINTAIEAVVDIMVSDYHPKAKIAKDVSAGAVLVTAFNAIIVGYFIFVQKIGQGATYVLNAILVSKNHITFIVLVILILVIVLIKSITKTGTPFSGGLPSGHSAVAFCILSLVWIYGRDLYIFSLCAVLSLLVAQSRIEGKIHNFYEVVLGALVGILISLLILNGIQFII